MPIDPDLLRDVSLFQLLDAEEREALSAGLQEAAFAAGQTIFKAGDPGGRMHVVVEGKVETFVLDEDKERVVLAEVTPGEMFGELSLLDGERRSASAVAVLPTRTFEVDREDLTQLFTRKPHAALDILAVLSRRIRATDQILAQRVARNPNQVIDETSSFAERVADGVARFGGSWSFIFSFGAVLLVWVLANSAFLVLHRPDGGPWDPYPFILLNLFLSMLAAIQAPVIMMSQNRQDAKDRVRSELDYRVNVRSEIEIMELHQKVDRMQEEILALLSQPKPAAPPARP